MSIAKHISQISEAEQAEHLRQLIEWVQRTKTNSGLYGRWPLKHADRELLIGILDQWIDSLEDENKEDAA